MADRSWVWYLLGDKWENVHRTDRAVYYLSRATQKPRQQIPTKNPATVINAAEETHRTDERNFWSRQISAAWALNIITFLAAAIAMGGIAVLWQQTQTLKTQELDTRSQISAFLTVPEDPQTLIKLVDWHFILDFHLANIGESTAREVYINTVLGLRGIDSSTDDYQATVTGGPLLISKQLPWSHIFDFGLPQNMTVVTPKLGSPTEIGKMSVLPLNFGVTLQGNVEYITVFREKITQPIKMVAGFGDGRIKCCNFLQLQKGVPMIFPADLTRIPLNRNEPTKSDR